MHQSKCADEILCAVHGCYHYISHHTLDSDGLLFAALFHLSRFLVSSLRFSLFLFKSLRLWMKTQDVSSRGDFHLSVHSFKFRLV